MMQKKMSRRDFLNLAAVTTAGSALAACAPAAAPSASNAGETGDAAGMEDVTINVWGPTGLLIDNIYAQFTEQTGISVNNSDIGDAVFGDQKYLTATAAGTGPDSAFQNRHTFAQFAAKGLYQDVTERMTVDGLAVTDFTPVQIEETSWEGKVYGLPLRTDVRYLYWNKDFYADAGLDPDSPPTTWTELEAYAEATNVFDADGKHERYGFVPYLYGNSWTWLYGFLNKAPSLSEDKRTVLADDERWVEALDWMVNFYDNYVGDFELANAFRDATQSAGLGQPFVAGRTAMTAHGNWFVGDLLRSPGVNWEAAPMPIPDGGEKSTWSCGWSYVLSPDAVHADQGWEFMSWIIGVEGWKAEANATIEDVQRTWEREQLEGEPQYWPRLACYLPALQMLEEEYVTQLPEREQNTWALTRDALENWTHGCGSEMGVAALEYWVEMDNSTRAALSHAMSAKEAMLQCKELVQEATDRAWEAIDAA
ncbi:MAG: extracellular solute-binding protein [Chloroflexota bacterium]